MDAGGRVTSGTVTEDLAPIPAAAPVFGVGWSVLLNDLMAPRIDPEAEQA